MPNDLSKLTKVVFIAMNQRDLSILEPTVTEKVMFDFPGVERLEGKDRVLLFLRTLLRKYPKLEFHVYDTILTEEKACVLWTNKGENSAGEPYENSGVTVLYFSGNKISFISDYFKDTSFVNG